MIKNISVDELCEQLTLAMESAGFTKDFIWRCSHPLLRKICRYAESQHVKFYSHELLQGFVDLIQARYSSGEISRSYRCSILKECRRMDFFYETGSPCIPMATKHKKYELTGTFKELHDGFLDSLNLKKKTRIDFSWAVRRFLFYFQTRGIDSVECITVDDARDFVVDMSAIMTSGSLKNLVGYLRQFCDYLKEQDMEIENWKYIFSQRIQRTMPIYDYVHDGELEEILTVIDTNTAAGKRDKAMILLGARLGLRACDIVKLKLTDVDWHRGELHVLQSKTQNTVILPLMKDVGLALRDYIENARPESDHPEVFLRLIAPFEALDSGVGLEYQFTKYELLAGVERMPYDGKGFHGLRRRLGHNMLTNGIPVTTIAQVLGQNSLEATMQYLSLDSKNLKECALDFQGIPVERSGLNG